MWEQMGERSRHRKNIKEDKVPWKVMQGSAGADLIQKNIDLL
jgi:hypothetical protein